MRMIKTLVFLILVLGTEGLLAFTAVYGIGSVGVYTYQELTKPPKPTPLNHTPAQKERVQDALDDGRIG